MIKISKDNLKIIEKYKKHRYALGKAKKTVYTDVNAIRKLARFIKNKNLKELKQEDLKEFFIEIKDFILRDHYASRIILFYKWFLELSDEEKPELMKWYKYSKPSERERQKDPNIKRHLITPEEYAKIIQKVRMDLRLSAIFETLYLSGGRPDEICNMKISDVINENGKITLNIEKSKSKPRQIFLTEKPSLLLRWLENHPDKNNKNTWLFISKSHAYKNKPIKAGSLSDKFKELIKDLDVKKTLILYSFRKTRATIMFNQGYDDKEMSDLFGWRPHTVIDRRNEYDLRGLEDLKKKIFQKAEIYKTRKQLEEENKNIIEDYNIKLKNIEEKYDKEIKELRKEIELHENKIYFDKELGKEIYEAFKYLKEKGEI